MLSAVKMNDDTYYSLMSASNFYSPRNHTTVGGTEYELEFIVGNDNTPGGTRCISRVTDSRFEAKLSGTYSFDVRVALRNNLNDPAVGKIDLEIRTHGGGVYPDGTVLARIVDSPVAPADYIVVVPLSCTVALPKGTQVYVSITTAGACRVLAAGSQMFISKT